MKNREFYIPCCGTDLHAKFDFPQTEKDRYPLVIIQHGLTGDMEERHITEEARVLNEGGYATLRTELYGHGLSGGSFHDHTLLLWVQELLTVIDYAASLDFVSELYLTGHSQGGAAAVLAAALKRDLLKAVILQAPALILKEDALKGKLFSSVFDPQHIPEELMIGDRPVSGNYARINQLIPFDEAVRMYEKPVLIVHGDADETVPYERSVELCRKYRQAELVRIPDDNHGFELHLEMVTQVMREFLDRQK